MLFRTRTIFTLGVVAFLLASSGAFAQAADPPYPYVIRPGDTLLSLARFYMNREADYLAVQKLNKVRDPRHLPIGGTLLVPNALLKSEPLTGEIASFRGAVKVDGQIAAVGMKIRQGMRVETGPSAFVTVRFPDGSAISLPSQSRIYVVKLRRVLMGGGLDRNFMLEAGRSQSTVTPMKNPSSNFRVSTPLSVSAVRGTDFRVVLEAGGGRAYTEVVNGTVGVATSIDMPEIKVTKGFGIVSTTAGLEVPIQLLPPPQLLKVEKTADGAMITARPVDGAVRYRTQLASDVNFHDVLDEIVTEKPVANFVLAAGATFYVRLTAIATSGLEGLPGTYAPGHPTALEVSANASGAVPQQRHYDN